MNTHSKAGALRALYLSGFVASSCTPYSVATAIPIIWYLAVSCSIRPSYRQHWAHHRHIVSLELLHKLPKDYAPDVVVLDEIRTLVTVFDSSTLWKATDAGGGGDGGSNGGGGGGGGAYGRPQRELRAIPSMLRLKDYAERCNVLLAAGADARMDGGALALIKGLRPSVPVRVIEAREQKLKRTLLVVPRHVKTLAEPFKIVLADAMATRRRDAY